MTISEAKEYTNIWYERVRPELVKAGLTAETKLAAAYEKGVITSWTFVQALIRECGWQGDRAVDAMEEIKSRQPWEPPATFIPGYGMGSLANPKQA